jgi:hypothetical protein
MDPDPDSPPFFIGFKNAKKYLFSYFFFYLAHKHIIFSFKNLIFCKNCVLKFYFAGIISVRSTHL